MSGVGCGAVRGTGSQALQQAAPPSPGSAPLRGRCHLVLAAERKRRDTLPRPLLLLLWLLSAGPVSLIFLPGSWGGDGPAAARRAERPAGRPPTAGAYGRRAARGPRRLRPIPRLPPGEEGKGGSRERRRRRARGSVCSGRRAASSRHGGSCRRPPQSRAPPPRSPALAAASAAPPPARPRSAPSPGGPAQLGPRRPPEAPPRARPPAAAPLELRARLARAEIDPKIPHAGPRAKASVSAPSAVLSLTLGPLCQKGMFKKRS